MKKIALFGATGRTGKHFMNKALSEGHTIKALVRSPEKVTVTDEKLTIIKGDVLSAEDVKKTIKDCDVVVSLFGHVKNSPENLQTAGTENIIDAMKEYGISKIISLSGGGLPFPEKDEPKFADKMIRFIMKVAFSKVLNDAIAHHKTLERSGLDWIIVRAPRLTEDEEQGNYRVGWVGVNASTKIARADLADFILKQVIQDKFLHQMPFVSY